MKKSKNLRKLIKAAKMEKPHAQYKLGTILLDGGLFPEDRERALALIGAAADAGYAPAREWLEDYSFDDDANVQAHS